MGWSVWKQTVRGRDGGRSGRVNPASGPAVFFLVLIPNVVERLSLQVYVNKLKGYIKLHINYQCL